MDNPAIEALQKIVGEKKESYRNHLKVHNHLKARATEEVHRLQNLRREIDALDETIQLISDAEAINDTLEKNELAAAVSPTVPDASAIAINVIEGKDALKLLESLL